jgi:hypothetical protein
MTTDIRLSIGDPSPEIAATYDALGELLAAWDRGEVSMSDDEFEVACADLMDRLIVLGRRHSEYSALVWALSLSRIRSRGED